MQPAGSDTARVARQLSHLAGVLLDSSRPGPPHWAAFLVFEPSGAQRHPRDPRYVPLTIAVAKLASGRWAIAQIAYEF
jgi:hypothetical protein